MTTESQFPQAPQMHPTRWGSPAAAAPLPAATRELVDAVFGITESEVVETPTLPISGLSEQVLTELRAAVGHDYVRTDDDTRRSRTRGKSTPDLLRARSGDLTDAPDVVVRPADHDQVVAVIEVAHRHHLALVPFGGGTSVTGGLIARRGGVAGVISIDLVQMAGVREVDLESMTAILEPGLRGPEAERLLNAQGLTLGHFPQSFEYASIGGFAATRSSGQASAGFGRFDSMVVGLTLATPTGTLELGAAPASAAGPDLRQLVLGSEGVFGVITAVRVRVRRLAEERAFEAWRFPSFESGRAAMRALAQAGRLPTVLRLSDETETMINLASQSDIGGEATDGCLMIVGYEAAPVVGLDTRQTLADDVARTGAVLAGADGTRLADGEQRGAAWAAGRFHAPYLRDSLLDVGVLVETLETATFWSDVNSTYAAVKAALTESLGEGTLVLCHVSHVYETGCSLYFTVAAREAADPLVQWDAAKAAASDAIRATGATITHHHAVGTDHQRWYAEEVGPLGISMLRAVKDAVDPTGIMNPGVLLP